MKNFKINMMHTLAFLIPFWGIMLLELVVRVKAIKDDYVAYSVIFIILMLILIAISYILPHKYRQKKKMRFNPVLFISWLALIAFMLYSDIVVPKNYCWLSLILLILFTGLFFVWSRYDNTNQDRLFSILLFAIETGFLFTSVACFLFRPYTAEIRYSGLSANPNVYGLYIITVWTCLLTKLDYAIGKLSDIKKVAIISLEFGMAAMFLYLTAARTAFLTVGIISLILFIFRLIYTRRAGKPFFKYVVTLAVCMTVSFFASYLALSTLPKMINKPIVYERDRLFTANLGTVCHAAAVDTAEPPNNPITQLKEEPSPVSRLFDAFKDGASLDSLLNGRISIYKSYISKLDNDGHKKYGRKIDGTFVVHAHNNVIQVAYTYGKGAAVAYVVLSVLSIILGIYHYIKCHDKRKTAAFPMLLIIAFHISSLTESILMPIQSLLAFCFYLCIGYLMIAHTPRLKRR